jgi:hypothetical protein
MEYPASVKIDAGSIDLSEGISAGNVRSSAGSACGNQPTHARKTFISSASNRLAALLCLASRCFNFLKIRISKRVNFLKSDHQIYLRRSSQWTGRDEVLFISVVFRPENRLQVQLSVRFASDLAG